MTDPQEVISLLAQPPRLDPSERLYVSWEVSLDRPEEPGGIEEVRRAGGTPWLNLIFRTPAPLLEHLESLNRELEEAARMAETAGPRGHFEIRWEPPSDQDLAAEEYAFLFKRAAVTLTGADPEARVLPTPLEPDPGLLRRFYEQDVAPYLDGITLRPAPVETLQKALETLQELDPGRPVVVDALPLPEPPEEALVQAAELAAAGVAVTLFRVPGGASLKIEPFKLLAREFAGDLSHDPSSRPEGAEGAWAFVRGEDLGLRVIVRSPPGTEELTLRFPDPQLRRPARLLPETGEALTLAGVRQTPEGLEVRLADPRPVEILRVERATAAELEGVAEEVTVATEREIPVEEILRRLQAFEDAQRRKLHHYQAVNTTQLRFQVGTGVQSIEATFEGALFFRQGEGFDWAWQSFYVNGIRWKWGTIPEIPLIQPEKAAAMPLEIHFTREYDYRLRGTGTVDGRDCWVVEFRPASQAPGERLHQGTVWIDREIYARVRTRSIQMGLEGETLSHEETISYAPVDGAGNPAPWQAESYILPVRVYSQQLLSLVNATTLVERESELRRIRVNAPDFEERWREVLASEVTMVRDTPKGLRYLVKDRETGERVVKEGYDTRKLFAVAGVFHDDSLDFPLPLAGINYFSFDFRGTGQQVNAFFAGALLTLNVANPRLFGSRFDLGGDLFALAVAPTDNLFREGREVPEEEVRVRPASVAFKLGRPVGSFGKLNLTYRLGHSDFRRGDDTRGDFVLPVDHFTHSVGLSGRYIRSGYQIVVGGTYNRRSRWEFWGLPEGSEFDPDARDYLRWEVAFSKNWQFRFFQKLALELNYLDGSDLDRFSKYDFGFFGPTRIHGYQSNRVRASRASAGHISYGIGLGEVFRFDLVGDAAVANDRQTGLQDEFLAGLGLVGTFLGPWRTVVNVDLGVPVAGPEDGFVAYLVFLKLFR